MSEIEKKEQSKTEYLQEIAKELLEDESWDLPKAVSYTHLDVYKRQGP